MPKLQVFITEVYGRKPARKGHITLKDLILAIKCHFYDSWYNPKAKVTTHILNALEPKVKQVVCRNNKLEERELELPLTYVEPKELREFIVKQLSPVAL